MWKYWILLPLFPLFPSMHLNNNHSDWKVARCKYNFQHDREMQLLFGVFIHMKYSNSSSISILKITIKAEGVPKLAIPSAIFDWNFSTLNLFHSTRSCEGKFSLSLTSTLIEILNKKLGTKTVIFYLYFIYWTFYSFTILLYVSKIEHLSRFEEGNF